MLSSSFQDHIDASASSSCDLILKEKNTLEDYNKTDT